MIQTAPATNGAYTNKYARVRALGAALWSEMQQNVQTWALIGEFIYPWRNQAIRSEMKSDATRRSTRIINSAAGLAFNSFRAGMLAGNSSPSQRWFKIGASDARTGEPIEDDEAKGFYEKLENAVYRDMAESNVYRALSLAYGDQGLYGTCAMLVIADSEDPFRCYTFPIGSYAIGQDDAGRPNAVQREFKMTAHQMQLRFGYEALSGKVRQALGRDQSGQNEFDVCHQISQNPDYIDGASDSRFKKFSECYYERGQTGETFLAESGYDSFPVIVCRWSPAGGNTPWGVGPGLEILGDVMQVQAMTRDETNAVEFHNNPAMIGPASLSNAYIKRRPGQFTAVDVQGGAIPVQPLFKNDLRLDHVEALIQRCESRINEALFKDLFKQFTGMPDQNLPRTAYLAQRMFQEKAGNLLPAMEQQYDELLGPLIDRVIQIRIETGKLTPEDFPESLQDGPSLKYDMISPFAEAQRASKTGGTETFLGLVGQATSVWPEAKNKVDIYAAIDELADGYSIPGRLVRSDDEVAEIDAAQAAAMRQQQALEAMPKVARSTKDLGAAPVGEGTALDAVMGAAPV